MFRCGMKAHSLIYLFIYIFLLLQIKCMNASNILAVCGLVHNQSMLNDDLVNNSALCPFVPLYSASFVPLIV